MYVRTHSKQTTLRKTIPHGHVCKLLYSIALAIMKFVFQVAQKFNNTTYMYEKLSQGKKPPISLHLAINTRDATNLCSSGCQR